ncbi:LysR substrate-binding domain-containing protein [Pararobbsia alpina]|uniref:LysR substrate-binding domain-containing protein n=1 Tax=Pararobbsia alpina TaxID=621374 RepID=UPI0039A41870
MEVKWIEDFIALTQHKTFSRAAQARSVTQPGLSRRIRSLELWLGAELFDRSTFPPALTPAGKVFAATAYDTLNTLFDTRMEVRSQQRMTTPGLRIAATHALAAGFVPRWLDSIQAQAKGFRARISSVSLNDGAMLLADGNCDLMVAHERPDEPARLDPARYPSVLVASDELIPVSRPDADGGPLYGALDSDGGVVPFACYSPATLFGRTVTELLSQRQCTSRFQVIYESERDDVIKQVVLNGRAMGWLSRSAIERELDQGLLVVAGGQPWRVPLLVRLYRDVMTKGEIMDRVWLGAQAHLEA